MILRNGSFSDFSERTIKQEKQIILYGAGVIGQIAAPYWLGQYQLDERVLCYVDADIHKHGMRIQLSSRSVPVLPLKMLEENRGRYVLLITASAFESVLSNLKQLEGTADTEVYFLPVMLLDIANCLEESGPVKVCKQQVIPKRIHYCWFSGKPIPDKLQRCIDSWKRYCPEYELVRWDESNYDIHQNQYMEQAYSCQKWGFVPDIARLDLLYRYGGIYLDTDVELLRPLDELLYQPAFCGVEKWGTVNFGGCSGAQAGNPIIKEILDFRKDEPFLHADGTLNQTVCGYYETLPLIKRGMEVNMKTQIIANGRMTVYSPALFHPFDFVSGETRLGKNTFSIHHFSGTWLGKDAAAARVNTQKRYREFLAGLEAEK